MNDMTNDSNRPLAGTRGLITGVANQHSIAWAVAKRLADSGMELAFTYQNDTLKPRVEKAVAELGDVPLYELDVQRDDHIDAIFSDLSDRWGSLDFVLHSVAFAPRESFLNPFVDTARDAFLVAHEVSAYSLVALTRAARPLMQERGGSILAMSYFAAEKVVQGYNVMGVAKASLESTVRYLAGDLGEEGIRINAISAGAVNTLAARGIPRFRDLQKMAAERAPMRRAIDVAEVAEAAFFLASRMSSATTGEILHVDAGYNIMGH